MVNVEDVASENIENTNLLKYLLSKYGNVNEILKATNSLFSSLPIFSQNKYTKIIRKSIPVGLVCYDLYSKIREYYEEKKKTIYDEHVKHIRDILQSDEPDTISSNNSKWTSEMIKWLCDLPEVQDFKILKYYNLDEYKSITQVDTSADNSKANCGVLIEYNNIRYLVSFEIISITSESRCFLKEIYTNDYDWDNFHELNSHIYRDYLASLDFDKNVISYDYDVEVRPRVTDVDFDFKTIDFDNFKKEIKTTLDLGYRRGYILTGNPGTGKTSILLRIENELREYPIFYVSPTNISDGYKINLLFSFLQTINPCVVCLEDFDSYDFKKKDGKLGVFLNRIDNSKDKLKVVYIATINDSSMLNYSLVRPGRFDQIIEIKEPTNNNDIYGIMIKHFNRAIEENSEYSIDDFPKRHQIKWWTFWRLKKYRLSQADYCEIIQKLILLGEPITVPNLIKSRDMLLKSKKSISKYKRNGDGKISEKPSTLTEILG